MYFFFRFQYEKEHLHWQETFRVFTTPNSSDEKEGGGVVDRVLPIDEFRYSI